MTGGWTYEGVQNSHRPSAGAGREELAGEVRRLIHATVTATASPATLAAAVAALRAVTDGLERAVPAGTGSGSGGVGSSSGSGAGSRAGAGSGGAGLAGAMPFDVVMGPCNPLAPPITIEFEPPRAIGHVVFTAPYEGAPGCVHGAVLAGAFDIVLTAANVIGGSAGPTRTLAIRYVRPTLVDTPSRFEAWVTAIDGRNISSTGRLLQDGVVTVEADGEFVALDRPLVDPTSRSARSDGSAEVS